MSDSDNSSNFTDFSDDSDSDISDTEEARTSQPIQEDDEEDEVIKAIKLAQQKKPSTRPPDIKLDSTPCNICFHPSEDIITVGDYDGNLKMFSYSNDENSELKSIQLEDTNTRDIKMTPDGSKIYALLKNTNVVIYHADGMKVERTIENASEEPGICMHIVDENVLAIGDEDGYVHAWDRRMNGIAFSHKVAEDSISSMLSDSEGRVLVAASTDGTISSLKVRGKKIDTQSEPYDNGFNCLGTIKQSTKLVSGDEAGNMYLFNWGEFGYHSDEYKGNKEAINSLIPITEKMVLTGGDDGAIRAVHFFPMKYCGIIGMHKYPVEALDVCNDGHLIASLCHDKVVRFWNVSFLETFTLPTHIKKATKETKKKDMKHNLPSSRQANAKEFYSGLGDS